MFLVNDWLLVWKWGILCEVGFKEVIFLSLYEIGMYYKCFIVRLIVISVFKIKDGVGFIVIY